MLAAKTPFFLEAVVGKEDNVFPNGSRRSRGGGDFIGNT